MELSVESVFQMLRNHGTGNPAIDTAVPEVADCEEDWVRESKFGRWFLSTNIWRRYVLNEGLDALVGMLGKRVQSGARVLDIGCGQGSAFGLLDEAFSPAMITGVDIDGELIDRAASEAGQLKCELLLMRASALQLPLMDASVDVVFCHQLLHHMTCQADALSELVRVLCPGGLLLMSESCRCFIESSLVRFLFRHPMAAQKAAEDYVDLVRAAGFAVEDDDIETAVPWWSRRDFGLGPALGWGGASEQVPTEVYVVGHKRNR